MSIAVDQKASSHHFISNNSQCIKLLTSMSQFITFILATLKNNLIASLILAETVDTVK